MALTRLDNLSIIDGNQKLLGILVVKANSHIEDFMASFGAQATS